MANSWRISGDIYDVSLRIIILERSRACVADYTRFVTQNYDRYDIRCPCADMLDCKLAGFREWLALLSSCSPSNIHV